MALLHCCRSGTALARTLASRALPCCATYVPRVWRSVQRDSAAASTTRSCQAGPVRRGVRTSAVVLSADAASKPPPAALVSRLTAEMKAAMRAKEKDKLNVIRFLLSAIKAKEIELRAADKALDDAAVLKVIQRLANQRKDSITSYSAGGRTDLVEKEQQELAQLESYLPVQMPRAEVQVAVDAAVAELGATSMKDMRRVMALVTERTQGQADSKVISELVKAGLTAAAAAAKG